jgi:hypothetical protein
MQLKYQSEEMVSLDEFFCLHFYIYFLLTIVLNQANSPFGLSLVIYQSWLEWEVDFIRPLAFSLRVLTYSLVGRSPRSG